MKIYSHALTLGFIFLFFTPLFVWFDSSSPTKHGALWLVFIAFSIAFFSLALFKKYQEEKLNKLNPLSQFVATPEKGVKKIALVGLLLFASSYFITLWLGSKGAPLAIPMRFIGGVLSFVGLIKQKQAPIKVQKVENSIKG